MKLNTDLLAKVSMGELREIYAAGWIDGYVSVDVSPRSVNSVVDKDFIAWLMWQPSYPLCLYWRDGRGYDGGEIESMRAMFIR